MASMTHAQMKAFALDPKNSWFFNGVYGEPKEMNCFLCKETSVSHGNNAQPFCKEQREELVCDHCNGLVLYTRKFCVDTGCHPYKAHCPPKVLEGARDQAFILRVMRTPMTPVNVPNADGEMCSAPTRKPEQTKSQSKRAM